jgi:hypothetical protein
MVHHMRRNTAIAYCALRAGREKLYEFLIIAGLITLFLLIAFGMWKYYDHRKYSTPTDQQKPSEY